MAKTSVQVSEHNHYLLFKSNISTDLYLFKINLVLQNYIRIDIISDNN